jgi:hypothetical protein
MCCHGGSHVISCHIISSRSIRGVQLAIRPWGTLRTAGRSAGRVVAAVGSAGEREELARRTEAVLISCPPLVAWEYSHVPAAGSEEARLLAVLRNPKDW